MRRFARVRFPGRAGELSAFLGTKPEIDPRLMKTQVWTDYEIEISPSLERAKALLDLFEVIVYWEDVSVDAEGKEHRLKDESH